MCHPKADIDRVYVKSKEGRTGLLQIEVTHSTDNYIAEYLNMKYKEDQFVNTVKSHESNQANMNSTIKTTAKVVEELNQSNKNSDTKKGIQHTKAILGASLTKNGKAK
jgi:hypothetical protein